MAKTVKCQWCGTPVVVAARVIYKKKSYHVKCAKEIQDRDEFLDYVCQQQFLKSPGPTIYGQRLSFIKKYGYTDKDMLQAVRYIYEVVRKGKNDAKWNDTIGLIPHIMDDAKAHWAAEEAKQNRLVQSFKRMKPTEEIVIHVQPKKQESKIGFIDPMSLLEEEGE